MNKNDLHPEALAIINDMEKAEKTGDKIPLHKMSTIDARNAYLAMRGSLSPPAPKVLIVKNLKILVKKTKINARYYKGLKNKDKYSPILIFFHGGGWVIGDLDTHDVICRQLANEGNFDVISVAYRLAPEYKFPVAINDAIDSINFISSNPYNLAYDKSKIALCGDSAGGNIAAVCSINAKINSYPQILFQALIYPSTHLGSNYQSMEKYDGFILSKQLMKWFEEKYLDKKDLNDWRAAPILYDNLKGLPETLLIVAGCDPLRDEGEAFAKALKDAGNKVEFHEFLGQIHGFLTMGARIKDTEKLIKLLCNKINKAFN